MRVKQLFVHSLFFVGLISTNVGASESVVHYHQNIESISEMASRFARSDLTNTRRDWAYVRFGYRTLQHSMPDETCQSTDRIFLGCLDATALLLKTVVPTWAIITQFHKLLPTDKKLFSVGNWLVVDRQIVAQNLHRGRNQLHVPSESQIAEDISLNEKIYLENKSKLKGFSVLFQTVFQFIDPHNYSLSAGFAINKFLETSIAPHTSYVPITTMNRRNKISQHEYSGIGVQVQQLQDGNVLINHVIDGGGAADAGLRIGDLVSYVDGQKIEYNRMQETFTEKVTGRIGSRVILTVLRGPRTFTLSVVRKANIFSNVSHHVIALNQAGSVGVIDINSFFNDDTWVKFYESLEKIVNVGVTGIVIDLRGNGGGQLINFMNIMRLFLEPNSLLLTEYAINTGSMIYTYKTPESVSVPDPVFKRLEQYVHKTPIVVLVNHRTASAAEATAGLLQEKFKALIVGERTFGKGTTINYKNAPNVFGEVKIQYVRGLYRFSSGRTPQLVGVTPDIEATIRPDIADLNISAVREEDMYRFPVLPPEEFNLPPVVHPKLKLIKQCVKKHGVAKQKYENYGDYAFWVAVDVLAAQFQNAPPDCLPGI